MSHFLTSVPTMIAMMLRERELLAQHDLSAVEARAHGLGADHPGADRPGARGASPRPRSATATARPRPGPSCSARTPRASRSPSCRPAIRIPRSQLRLVRDGKEVQDEGVLEMNCGALMTRYHKLPEATAKAMTPDGYYRTGDVFRRDENGFYFFVGRADDMFVCGGENIYPGEVEKMLERHPGIHQAAVIPVPDELKGHKPIAFVVRAERRRPRRAGGEELRAGQRAGLPASAPRASSSTRCRWPAPTRSTSALARASRSRRGGESEHESRRRPRAWRARPPELRDRLPRSRSPARAT